MVLKNTTPARSVCRPPCLLWNERGQIGCARPGHAPYKGSDTWMWERWSRMSPRSRAEFSKEIGREVECEVCRAEAKRRSEPADDDPVPTICQGLAELDNQIRARTDEVT